jgi:hypothetical protein
MYITYKKCYTCAHEVHIAAIHCEFSIAIIKLAIKPGPYELVTLANKCKVVSRERGLLLEQECNEWLLVQGEPSPEKERLALEAKIEKWMSNFDTEE